MNYGISNKTASLINEMAIKFYEDPENVRKFNEWKKERDCGGKNIDKEKKAI